MRIGIIGTAGRKEDGPKLNARVYTRMVNFAYSIVDSAYKTRKINDGITLVSGGAAWADHIAISVKKKNPLYKLELHLPCHISEGKFTGDASARTANFYHSIFSLSLTGKEKNEWATRQSIQAAVLDPSCTVIQHNKGFFHRNLYVGATLDLLLAFTFNNSKVPKDGGTKHTWDHSPCKDKRHYDIALFLDNAQGRLPNM